MKNKLKVFDSAILAGLCIGISGFGFLVNNTIGMFLFIFGLATVVNYGAKLFTGTAGFVENKQDIIDLGIILIGNIVGCLFIALIARSSIKIDDLQIAAYSILNSRLSLGPICCLVQAIGCGFLMTSAVTFARQGKEIGNWIPLILAIPLFILCGFPHCIADAFYYLTVPISYLNWKTLFVYISIVIGNFIGCNLYRLLTIND